MPEAIPVVINGENRQVPAGMNVAELLRYLELAASRVAIERNLGILPRNTWAETAVAAGDRFEIVHLVGGG